MILVYACGSANGIVDEIENIEIVDTTRISHSATDSIGTHPCDTIKSNNDSIESPKDGTSNDNSTSKTGDSIIISNSKEIEYQKLFTIKSSSGKATQGLAIYKDELFNFHDSNDVVDIYSISTGKQIASIKIEPEKDVHCNTVSFSSIFYEKGDKYPLIYVQQGGNYNKANVYRIIYKDSIYSMQKIQTVSFTPCSHTLTAIDTEKKLLYVIYANHGRYITFTSLPDYSTETTIVNLSKTNKTYALTIPKVVQDTAFDNDCLYFLCGVTGQGELWIIDLQKKNARVISLTKYGLNAEPEGLEVYQNDLIVSFINKAIYRISIKQ